MGSMYCITCGTNNTETTRFCTRCGANLETLRQSMSGPLSQPPQQFQLTPGQLLGVLIISGIVALGALGLVFGVFGPLIMRNPNAADSPIPVILAMGAFATLGFYFRMVYKLVAGGHIRQSHQDQQPPQQTEPRRAGYQTGPQQALPPGVQAVPIAPPSVVEHTTAHLPKYAPPEPD